MPKYTMEMVLEYAKVFPQNADMGDPNGNKTQKSIADKGGQYVVNAYFTSQDQIDKLLEEGLDPSPMNSERIKEGNEAFGIGKFMSLKRPVPDNEKTFENKNGSVTINYGGAPGVVDLREGNENKRWWSYEDDGLIGNGTRAMVQFETYSNGAGVRLKNVGILELVEYEITTSDEDDIFNMDEVA
jgi:hypothetical protein